MTPRELRAMARDLRNQTSTVSALKEVLADLYQEMAALKRRLNIQHINDHPSMNIHDQTTRLSQVDDSE